MGDGVAYRIKASDGDVQDAVRRIADEQLDRALREIERGERDFAERVHQVRKRCKKLRGLIRLVRPAFDGYAAENRAIRDAARRVSDLRDADTLIATYDAVAGHFADQIDRRAFAPIRARLTRDARGLRDDPTTPARIEDVRRALEAARERAATWTLDESGFAAVAGGLGKTYGRARARMRTARSNGEDEAMHAWRKRVKYHWYHARLLGDIFPAMLDAQAQVADDLSDLLGDHHDLVVLDARLREAPGDFGTATDLDAFRALLRERKDRLAAEAFGLGRLLLAERRGALVARWGRYWRVARGHGA